MAERSTRTTPASAVAAPSRKGPRPRRTKAGASTVPPARAAAFVQTRRAHARETAEDYAEAIAELMQSGGGEAGARVVELARVLGVSHVTVIRTISRLRKAGLVTAEPYKAIYLTPAGRELARRSRRRHQVVLDFLLALGVPDAAARTDAEGIEHHVGSETLDAFERFTLRHERK